MAANGDKFSPINPLGHISGLASVADKVAAKKRQQQQKQKQKKHKHQQIDEQLEEELEIRQKENDKGHIDFHA